MDYQQELSQEQSEALISILKSRFETNQNRHPNLRWAAIEKRLKNSPKKLWSLNEMERIGGEPDVMEQNSTMGEFVFCDFSEETPSGRRSLCYDRKGLESRRDHRPKNSAIDMAEEMGIDLLTEEDYRCLQNFGAFDSKTSSWLKTPSDIRQWDGAIFGDFRFGHVFVYHNGPQSYYAGRGFRGVLKI
ncbi:DUF4256 domain-containing protein [Gelidibacter sp.]|uniref:DUF4256 domain-containing protein n=1 Tax=Gelidibacter sp. TaxID=2018083 RepID=UPI002CE656C8|nr:DUF4256 domain-containing protein [Gelidibacter sp.]HUH29744.1 DUF4256 domain-containing protein [Gelidibacter sp.]